MSHHKFSPSKLEQYRLCPGSCELSAGLPDEITEDAQFGTQCHEAIKSGKIENLNTEQVGYVEKCNEFLKKLGGSWELEVQLSYVDDNFEEVLSGTADAVRYNERKLTLVDWKFGRNPVTKCSENLQLMAYAYMASQKFETDEIGVIIFQPTLNVIDSYIYKPDELNHFPELFSEIKRNCENGLQLIPSEKACRYCKAKNICPAYKKFIEKNINALTLVEHAHELPAEKIGEWLDKWKMIKTFGDRLEHRAKEMLLQNIQIPGWGLKTRAGSRTVTNPQGVFEKVSDIIDVNEFMNCVDISLSKLEDIYATKMKEKENMPKTKAKKELTEKIAEFVERKQDQIILTKTTEE